MMVSEREAPTGSDTGGTPRNTLYLVSDSTSARMPYDAEVELSVLAEAADPLHLDLLRTASSADFYDRRNARVLDAVKVGNLELLSTDDRAYFDHAVRYAFPVVAGTVDRFFDLAARRRRLVELEHERLELLGVSV